MQFKKDPNMKYTELCMYVDKHMWQLNDPDCPEEISNTIYNYLWLLVKALAIKKRMFTSFSDYDGYAFYAANRLFFAIRNNLENQGKVIRGREVKPIKSCLNYTKTLLFPMKVDYLRDEKSIDSQVKNTTKNFNEFIYRQHIRDEAWRQQGIAEKFRMEIKNVFYDFNSALENVLLRAPFPKNSSDYKKLKISIMLNVLYNLNHNRNIDAEPATTIVWKLPKSTSSYVKLFLKELSTDMMQTLMEYHDELEIDDSIISYMISNPDGEFIDNEKSQY